jgi:branched-subunit amino acid ABC-type transport system permease component
MNLHKVTKIAAIVISVLSLVFLGGLMASDDAANSSWITPLIYLSYVILIACIALVLIYVFKNLLSKKEDLKKTMISLGLFLVLILVSFILADGEEVKTATNEIIASESTSKWVSTGLNMFYLLAVVAVGTMFWTGLNKIKK